MGKEGFIVHPNETGSGKYSASYGDNNKTVRQFKTLKKAKAYLAKKGIKKAGYDSPTGFRDVTIKKTNGVKRRKPKRKKVSGIYSGIRLPRF